MSDARPKPSRRGRLLVPAILGGVVVGMVGLTYAAVPLYTLFCQATGLGGTTQVAAATTGQVLDRTIKIRFTADTDNGLPWDFAPEQREVTVRLGEGTLAYFSAQNRSNGVTAGTAVYNVSPAQAGLYFTKTECFCFTEQALAPGQKADLPVYFYVDPALADDPALDDLTTITLSYAFFPVGSNALDRAKADYYQTAAGETAPATTVR